MHIEKGVMTLVKIYIDPGHGGSDPGAVGNGIQEKDITLQIGLAMRNYLNEYKNVSVRMSRTNDRTVSLSARTNDANKWGADYYVSIHINAGGGTGFESYIYRGISNSSQTAKIRNSIHTKIVQVAGLRDRGKKQANFHVLRETRMPAILTENGFIDTKSDANKMKNRTWINKVAKAHADGIVEFYKLKKKSNAKVTNPSTVRTNKNEKYVITNDTPGYYTANDAKTGTNRRTTVQAGTYYVFKRHDGMINVTKRAGSPGSWINPNSASTGGSFKVGDRVSIKQSTKTYATGQQIPSWVKGRKHTIQQISGNRVLLKEIYSWVRKTDIVK